nr:phage holin family protein [Pedobacter sp. SYSU D00535]
MRFIIEFLLIGLAVLLSPKYIPGIEVDGFVSAVIAGVLISFANATIGAILRLFTFPLNLMTLGLMSFVISVLMVLLVDYFMTSFNTSGFTAPVLLAALLAVIKIIFGIAKKFS